MHATAHAKRTVEENPWLGLLAVVLTVLALTIIADAVFGTGVSPLGWGDNTAPNLRTPDLNTGGGGGAIYHL